VRPCDPGRQHEHDRVKQTRSGTGRRPCLAGT
jgi:hypothetical protein